MKKTQAPAWVALLALLSFSCRKQNDLAPATTASLVTEAKAYFTSHIENNGTGTQGSAAALSARTVDWQNAVVTMNGTTVAVPLQYASPQFLTLSTPTPVYFSINNVSELQLSKDSSGRFSAVVQIRMPDADYLAHPEGSFSGTVFQETWDGSPLPNLHVTKAGNTDHNAARVITVCSTINGYNYAPSAPGDGYNWSRTTCYSMNIPDTQDGGASGASSGGSGGSGGSSGPTRGNTAVGGSSRPAAVSDKTVRIPPPADVITNIPDYLRCFGASPAATYQVQVCVAQPEPGVRTPWRASSAFDFMNSGKPVEVGHTFIVLIQNNGGGDITMRNVGFYPGEMILPTTGDVQGVFHDDGLHHYNISASFNVSATNFMNMVNYVNSVRNHVYNLSTFNCTTFALNTLDQGHVYLPNVIGSWPGGMGNDPGDLGEDIRNSNAPGIQKNTTDGIHNNQGSCDH